MAGRGRSSRIFLKGALLSAVQLGCGWSVPAEELPLSQVRLPPGPWGRPADVEVAPDGSLLVSDDFAGAVYRITYRGN